METFFETIDDHLINWYFSHEKEFEKPFQKILTKTRFDLINNNNLEIDNSKALSTTEDILFTYVYTLFKKKEIELLKDYLKYNSYDKNFLNLYQSRRNLDNLFLHYLNSKIDF
jgi:hypothetical protein